MKIAIVVFSPSGNTLKVAEMLEMRLNDGKNNVQIVNLTRNKDLFKKRKFKQFLMENVMEHDILCVGSPVYAHHLHYNMQDLMKSLPTPGNGWGRLAVPFVTYGGINSGIALQEAAKLLKKTGRTPIAGMKIESEHCLTKLKQITTKVNNGMPGEEINHLLNELVNKICSFGHNGDRKDVSDEFCYQSWKTRIKAKILFREKIWQRYLYPKVIFNSDQCKVCGKCSRVCPVQRIEMTKHGPTIPEGNPECIHCGSCVSVCPSNSITFNANWEKWNHLLKKAAEGHSPLSSNEKPRSAIYG